MLLGVKMCTCNWRVTAMVLGLSERDSEKWSMTIFRVLRSTSAECCPVRKIFCLDPIELTLSFSLFGITLL